MRAELAADRIMASKSERVITGRLVPYAPEIGHTSAGPTTVRAGAIREPADPSRVKLLADHDTHDPVAVLESVWTHSGGLYGSFRVPPGDRGDRALIEAETTRDGLSVGLEVHDHVDAAGVIEVLDAELIEVSQLAIPAFKSAQVTTVAESLPTEEVDHMSEQQTPEVETLTAEQYTEIADERAQAATAELGESLSERLAEITAAISTGGEPDPGRDLTDVAQLVIEAGRNREALVVEAALGVTTTTESAVPERYVQDLVDTINAGRPVIEAIRRRDIGASGLNMNLPAVTQPPTVAEQLTENTEVSSQQLVVAWQTTALKTFAGGGIVTRQAIDRAEPSSLAVLLDELATAYAHATDADAVTTIKAAIPAGNKTVTASDLLVDLSELAGDIAAANGNFDVCLMGINQWKALLQTVWTAGPAYYSGNTALANTFPGTIGNLGGVRFVRSANLGADDLVGMDSRSVSWWESSSSPFQVRAENPDVLNTEISVAGYGACSVERDVHLAEITQV